MAFYSLTSSLYDDPPSASDGFASPDQADQLMRDSPYAQTSAQTSTNIYEHPCAPLTKILSSGTFYHATYPHWDLSTRLSDRLKRGNNFGADLGDLDERFVWNEYIVRSLLDFRDRLDPRERQELDRCQFIVCKSLCIGFALITKFLKSDTSHSGLCRCLHCTITCSSSSRLPNDWDLGYDLSVGLEACRHAFQHARRR